MLPGMATPMLAGGRGLTGYAGALAAISNKTLLLQADLSTASNGATLATTPFVNSGSAGSSFNYSGATWITNFQNGMRAAKASDNTGLGQPLLAANVFPTKVMTAFFVGQFGSTSSYLIGDDQGTFEALLRRNGTTPTTIGTDSYTSSISNLKNTNTSNTVADNTSFVAAVRISSDGSVRYNLNGTITSFTAASQNTDGMYSPSTTLIQVLRNANDYLCEAIVSSSAQTNTAMDTMVTQLRSKWAI